jgi:hypothetical protein
MFHVHVPLRFDKGIILDYAKTLHDSYYCTLLSLVRVALGNSVFRIRPMYSLRITRTPLEAQHDKQREASS